MQLNQIRDANLNLMKESLFNNVSVSFVRVPL